MKELIRALRSCLAVAVSDGLIEESDQALVNDHINSLEDLTLRNDAIALLRAMEPGKPLPQDTAAGALAKVTMMLTLYGSKPDAMLAVIHDKGWEVVTLADVEAVRKFILEQ
jgi:uncharacterized membrane protein YebE (DUF533 family)